MDYGQDGGSNPPISTIYYLGIKVDTLIKIIKT